MKQTIKLHVWLFLLYIFYIISCASVIETKLKENPDFVKNAEKFIITSPLSHTSSGFNKFILEDINTNNVYEIKPQVEYPVKDVSIFEEEESKDRQLVKTKEFTSHRFFLSNPLDNREYEVIGKTTYFRSKEKKRKTSSESGKMIYPVEFWIFEQGNDVGKITMDEPGFTKAKLEILIHNKIFNLEYQAKFNNECYSFEDENGLITLILLKSKGTIAFKKTGEILLNQGLSEDLRSDIIGMYLIVETIFSMIREVGI